MISSLLHFVGLRPRVYYTLTNFRGGGKAPLHPPQYANDNSSVLAYILKEFRIENGYFHIEIMISATVMLSARGHDTDFFWKRLLQSGAF